MDGVLSRTAQIVSAHASKSDLSANELSTLIRTVHQALATIGQTVAEPLKAEPAVSALESVFPNHIVCLDCGKGVKMLKRHIGAHHGLTPGDYRAKWGLPASYPIVAPNYANTRSTLARQSGLGKRR